MPGDDALISTFGRLLEAGTSLERQLGRSLEEQAGLPHTWFEVLLRTSRSPAQRITMSDLAGQVALTSGGTTRLVDRMVDAGLVRREPCPTDRRVAFVALTAQGRQRLTAARRVHVRDLRRVFRGLTAEELTTLDGLLDRLRAAT